MTFGAHKLVHSEPYLDYLYEVWQLLSAPCNAMRKKNLYSCTSTFLALNYCSGIFSQLSIRSGAHKLFCWFLDFSQFLTAISLKLWCQPATKWELCSASERMIYSEKITGNWYQNQRINCHTILVWTMPPRSGRPSVTYKKHLLSLLQPARVVQSSPNFACW